MRRVSFGFLSGLSIGSYQKFLYFCGESLLDLSLVGSSYYLFKNQIQKIRSQLWKSPIKTHQIPLVHINVYVSI